MIAENFDVHTSHLFGSAEHLVAEPDEMSVRSDIANASSSAVESSDERENGKVSRLIVVSLVR